MAAIRIHLQLKLVDDSARAEAWNLESIYPCLAFFFHNLSICISVMDMCSIFLFTLKISITITRFSKLTFNYTTLGNSVIRDSFWKLIKMILKR